MLVEKKRIIVIKCGGSILDNNSELGTLLNDIPKLQLLGYTFVIVHGGGPGISRLCEAFNLKNQFIDGLRVTDKETLRLTQMSLLGDTNLRLVHQLNQAGIAAVGLSGHDHSLLEGDYLDREKWGFVGQIKSVNCKYLNLVLDQDIIPVIAPLAIDSDGNTLNVNADNAAASIASALECSRLILLSDIDGYYQNYPDKGTLINSLTDKEVEELLATPAQVAGGMRPKLSASLSAIRSGVRAVHIINGSKAYALSDLITGTQTGTTITRS